MRVGVGLSLAALGRVTQAGWADDQISAPDTGGRLFTLGASFGSGPVLRFLSVTETTISGFGDTVRNAQMTANPRIRVREATPADVEALVDIYFAAFDDNVMNQLMYPRGVSADSRRKFGEKLSPKPSAGSAAETTTKKEETFVYVAEYLPEEDSTGPGGVVAFAKWSLHREPRAEEEWKADDFTATTETWGEDCDVAVVNAFIGEMNRIQRDHAKGEAALCN